MVCVSVERCYTIKARFPSHAVVIPVKRGEGPLTPIPEVLAGGSRIHPPPLHVTSCDSIQKIKCVSISIPFPSVNIAFSNGLKKQCMLFCDIRAVFFPKSVSITDIYFFFCNLHNKQVDGNPPFYSPLTTSWKTVNKCRQPIRFQLSRS